MPLQGGNDSDEVKMADSVQIADGYLIGHLRLIRSRLVELIDHDRLLTSEDLRLLVCYIDAVEDKWHVVEDAVGQVRGGSGYGLGKAGSSQEP